MADVKQTTEQLNSQYGDCIYFLKSSVEAFDKGYQAEAKRLAVTARVLLHDTGKSTSLLKLLDRKGVDFLDSAIPVVEGNILSHSGLTQTHTGSSKVSILSILDANPPKYIDFNAWWNGVVFVNDSKQEFSRKDIVLSIANQDGGAHVDPKLDKRYAELKEGSSLGWRKTDDEGKNVPLSNVVEVSMRQIAHELLKTLEPTYSCKPQKLEQGSTTLHMSFVIGNPSKSVTQPKDNLTKNRPMVAGKKVSRIDDCPCGSGKKYEDCCI